MIRFIFFSLHQVFFFLLFARLLVSRIVFLLYFFSMFCFSFFLEAFVLHATINPDFCVVDWETIGDKPAQSHHHEILFKLDSLTRNSLTYHY